MANEKSVKVFVSTPDGQRVHGEIIGTRFVRFIKGDYVRWSDRSFCINTSAMPKLMENNVFTLQFRYRMAEKLMIYEYPIHELNQCEIKVNEHGEENIRIPIEMCKLVKTYKLDSGGQNGS